MLIKVRFTLPALPENFLSRSEAFIKRRRQQILIVAGVAILAAGGATYEVAHHEAKMTGPKQNRILDKNHTQHFLNQIGQSLIDQHQSSMGGWRFKSEIQAPHYQTDRDVGAASVGMGFLALADAEPYTNNSRWIDAAKQTANWLTAVSSQDGKGGRYWHDYVDNQEISPDIYTSFDDGTIGIGDYFWQLYEKTGDQKYKQVAIESLRWTLSQAEPYNHNGLSGYRWKWNIADPNSPYYMGMGEGQAGITYALASYYERLQHSDPELAARCKVYVLGSLNYIESVRHSLAQDIGISRSIPETGVIGKDGDTALDSGYLSGAAGDAFMYLKLYKVFGDKQYLNKAIQLLGWLSDAQQGPLVKLANNSDAWKLMIDSHPKGGNNNRYATGIEEGAAGIGWTYLQAYGVQNNEALLQIAEAAGNWLIDVAIKDSDGSFSWHEDEHPQNPLIHANLDNGAAGIGTFLEDLYHATGQQKYHTAAVGAFIWLMKMAEFNGNDIYWQDNGGNDPYTNDPSWHWGKAGIAAFIQRMNGGSLDMPGEQPGFSSRALASHK